jgi:prepilin-type N-terminal cleavage/methylation domain-containing protein
VSRRGFTLIEVIVALVVTGLVVSLAYATMQAGLDTSDRLESAQQVDEREGVARALLSRALRHAAPGTIGGSPVFVLLDQPRGDELRFLTRGVSEPLGASELWELSLTSSEGGIRLSGRSTENPSRSFQSTIPRVRAIDVLVRGRDFREAWLQTWLAQDRSPVAVSIEFLDGTGRTVGAPLRARVGLEGNP